MSSTTRGDNPENTICVSSSTLATTQRDVVTPSVTTESATEPKTRTVPLRADHVDEWIDQLANTLATTTLREIHGVLKRAIRQAQARDMVLRNVAELVTTPTGTDGRPSRALTRQEAEAVLKAAEFSELHAYVVLSLTAGVRTEEARALRWDHDVAWIPSLKTWHPETEVGFQHKKFAIYVWRADREGGDTKTRKSRRTLDLPKLAARALRQHHTRQAILKLKVGEAWQDHNLVFCTSVGTPLDASNVRRPSARSPNERGSEPPGAPGNYVTRSSPS
ncbi:tyrosine recombinase XerC [Nonomuraea sp. NPDC049028]|uniref:site-specific integrase n=1 Tax=Nonomuraea sp. NPDC049028 TaxID=3364348 RepID=UPI003718E62C